MIFAKNVQRLAHYPLIWLSLFPSPSLSFSLSLSLSFCLSSLSLSVPVSLCLSLCFSLFLVLCLSFSLYVSRALCKVLELGLEEMASENNVLTPPMQVGAICVSD